MEDFLPFYWVQEFSKNEDGNYARSVFFTWEKGGPVRFGPLWDFDLAFGNASREGNKGSDGWYIRYYRLYNYIFWCDWIEDEAKAYWIEHREKFRALMREISGRGFGRAPHKLGLRTPHPGALHSLSIKSYLALKAIAAK